MAEPPSTESISHLTKTVVELTEPGIVIAVLAVFIATLTFVWSMIAHAHEARSRATHQALDRWDGILSTINEHPQLLVPDEPRITPADQLAYEAFNYKVWSLVDYIISHRLDIEPQFRSIIYWVCTQSRAWLDQNPFMFGSRRFWTVIGKISNEPLTLFRAKALPKKDGEILPNPDRYQENIDWASVAVDYARYVITPFSEEMTASTGGKPARNRLLSYVESRYGDELRTMSIADYGCGPGNLIKCLPGKLTTLTGIDLNPDALNIAQECASRFGVTFTPICADMRTYVPPPESRFDLIFSINSILPATRAEVTRILENIARSLKPNGILLAILPSFDTTEKLVEYWQEHYATLSKDKTYLDMCMTAFKIKKKMDSDTRSFADDNIHPQCFHTPETIKSEFPAAGLEIVENPEKIYYPWEIARRFDYGYFPKKEEIWDWFVIATRSRSR